MVKRDPIQFYKFKKRQNRAFGHRLRYLLELHKKSVVYSLAKIQLIHAALPMIFTVLL